MAADWWEWHAGSRLFFWRWPQCHRVAARDGYAPFIQGSLPAYHRPQQGKTDSQYRNKVIEKLKTVRDKRYISRGSVMSLTSFFWVPKGERDIRMVYDATRSGLNEALWAPSFGMPTVDSLTRGIMPHSWMGDLDIGEMFLNFCIHPSLAPYCGVDLRPYFPDELGSNNTLWERWERCMMGLKPSPYVCIKGLLLALELVKGNRLDPMNPFHWLSVHLNLPGMINYDPSKPKIWRSSDSQDEIAALVVSYMDDMRAAASSELQCWTVMHKIGVSLTYLGIQVAARKTRPPTQTPGAWAGSVVLTDAHGVGVRLTQEKWDKTKTLLVELLAALESADTLDRKWLESARGTLVYVQRTYPSITPYLKGFHLTIDAWRPGRNKEGWRLQYDSASSDDSEAETSSTPDQGCLMAPARVRPVPRLRQDVQTLMSLFEPLSPPSDMFAHSKSA
jgi:hypothetical protein